MGAQLEHTNLTVPNPDATAKWMCELFDWKVRWSGDSIFGGYSVHVGNDDSYLALYDPHEKLKARERSYGIVGGLNHVGIVVNDLDAAEAKVKALGFEPNSHADYEPGRRFYFRDDNDIEFELVEYA
jgi:lactoylglutathione lyase